MYPLLIAPVLATLMAAPLKTDVWRPPQRPPTCQHVQIEALLVDVSISMKRDRLFDVVQQNMVDHIRTLPPCNLEIVASFGTTADVQTAEFITPEKSRKGLVQAVRTLRPIHSRTNLDEAGKLIELLSYQLRRLW